MGRSPGGGEEEGDPADHARGGSHGSHEAEEEGAVDRVKGFTDVDVDGGSRDPKSGEDMRKEGGERDSVTNAAPGEVGGLLWANRGA